MLSSPLRSSPIMSAPRFCGSDPDVVGVAQTTYVDAPVATLCGGARCWTPTFTRVFPLSPCFASTEPCAAGVLEPGCSVAFRVPEQDSASTAVDVAIRSLIRAFMRRCEQRSVRCAARRNGYARGRLRSALLRLTIVVHSPARRGSLQRLSCAVLVQDREKDQYQRGQSDQKNYVRLSSCLSVTASPSQFTASAANAAAKSAKKRSFVRRQNRRKKSAATAARASSVDETVPSEVGETAWWLRWSHCASPCSLRPQSTTGRNVRGGGEESRASCSSDVMLSRRNARTSFGRGAWATGDTKHGEWQAVSVDEAPA